MSQPQTSPSSYAELARSLRAAGVATSPAEVHGLVTGVLCGPETGRVSWSALVPGAAAGGLTEALDSLREETLARLHEPEFAFAPLLPDDAAGLSAQVDAFAEWCHGFLTGLAAAGVKDLRALPENVAEFIRDLLPMSEVEREQVADEEDETRALAELIEYLRVGVQLVYEELRFREPARH